MSDDDTGSEHEGMNQTPPPDGSDRPPVYDFTAVAETVHKRRNPFAIASIIVGILALIGGGVFAANNLTGTKSGGSTPEETARALYDAVAHEDVLGVLENLVPGERDALREPLKNLRDELVRLDVLKSDFDLAGIKGVNLEFKNLQFTTTNLSSDIALVKTTSGVANYRVDPQLIPFGSFVRELAGPALLGSPTSGSSAVKPEDEANMVVVRQNGRWYVSLGYTIAESARSESGAPVPSFGGGLAAAGKQTPEAAVEALLRAAVALDFETMIAVTPPDEAAALHDYAPMFIQAAKTLAAAAGGKYRATITELQLASEKTSSGALVTIKKIAFKASSPDGKFALDFDGDCLSGRGLGPGFPPRLCSSDLKGAGLPQKTPHVGFVTVQRGGVWYVSPLRTLVDGITAVLKVMDKKDLDQIKGLVGQFASSA
jgi:hypothetical protein